MQLLKTYLKTLLLLLLGGYTYAQNVGVGTSSPASSLDVNGSFARKVVSVTSSYTLSANDNIVLASGASSAVTLTLPTAVGIKGRMYVIKATNLTNTVRIATSGSETVDGNSIIYFATLNDVIEIVSDGANWYVVNKLTPSGYGQLASLPGLSCKDILTQNPATVNTNGTYWIDPDGAGGSAAYPCFCEMTTDGGGWTLNFSNYTNLSLGTTASQLTSSLIHSGATEVMVYYASDNTSYTPVNQRFKFTYPAGFNPWTVANGSTVVTVKNLSTGVTTSNSTLIYGSGNFSSLTCDAWTAGTWGRFGLCIGAGNGSNFDNFPYYNSYSTAGLDNCSNSSQAWSSTACSTTRFFVLFER